MNNTIKQQELSKMKRLATVLLLFVTGLFIIARLQHGLGGWAWVAAFAEAAMIGALADWFAVVALFKRPLGLPIPHTAIIPCNKLRIADNLALFVRDKFLATDTLVEKIRAFDPAQKIAGWLASGNNADLFADKMQGVLIKGLDFIDDARVQAALHSALQQNLNQVNLGQTVGKLLGLLTEDKRHQLLLNEALRKLAAALDDADTQKQLAAMIIEIAGREYPSLLQMLGMVANTDEFSLKIASSLVANLNSWLHEIGDDPAHPRRAQFDQVVEEFLERMKNDPDFHAKIEGWKQQLLASPLTAMYIGGLWGQLKNWLRTDMSRADSDLRQKIADAARNAGQWLIDNPALRDSVNQHMADAARAMAVDLRDTIAVHIATTVKQWDDAELVRELELSVGSDLQYIRLNGTVVGGLIGLLLHAVVMFLP
ncbi:DUF445 domain-containing protein [Undibacterium sp. Ren11W]|uniref:DUF445 domain-containing protein n=1 Tax=Undibacterium sp. Ren11W TaxID=3413045 RepID=UPI003BF12693